jgi:P-type Mg2+ transporter
MDRKLFGLKHLTSAEAKTALAKYGYNSIQYHSYGFLKVLWNQFTSPMIWLLVLAFVITAFTDSQTEALVILCIIVINTFLGFVQEYRSNNIFKKLTALITSRVDVIRDNHIIEIDKKLLVPGDLIILRLGSIVPADCLVVQTDHVTVDESAITGESFPVNKKDNLKESLKFKEGLLSAGTVIRSGEVIARVYATGKLSKFGMIADLSLKTENPTAYEQNLKKLSRDIMLLSFLALALIFILHLIFNVHESFYLLLLFIVSISISVIPEALPVITTVTLSHKAVALGKKGIVVKKMSSLEDLGNVDLICTDKTGTLTLNEMQITKPIVAIKSTEEFNKYCFQSSVQSNDPFDKAIIRYFEITNYQPAEGIDENFKDKPFDPFSKISSRKFADYEIIKGAPEVVLAKCGGKGTDHAQLIETIEEQSKKGFRALSLALVQNGKYKLLGTLFFFDPIKEDVRTTLESAKLHGIDIKIITGDSFAVAAYVGKEVGLVTEDSEVVDATALIYEEPRVLEQQVLKYKIFCRADPIQKYKIIEALQQDHNVAYLGDGINDAPSLQLAEVGIVVDTATDIAKSSADIILLKKNLSAIVAGVIEGRRSFENIEKYLIHNLTGNFGNFLTIGFLSVFLPYLPMLPIQILISNLLVDILALNFAFDQVDNVAIKKPIARDFSAVVKYSLILGALTTVLDLILFSILRNYPPGQIQTFWFASSAFVELLFALSVRTHNVFWKSKPQMSLFYTIALEYVIILLITLFGIPGVPGDPLQIKLIGFLLITPLVYFIGTETLKLLIVKKFNI